jgi:hypothetical protein
MLSGLPTGSSVVAEMALAIAAAQHFNSNGINVLTFARASGDMCTSLGNGFSNLMLILFFASEHGWPHEPDVLVEGDDSVWRGDYDPLTLGDFASLGFELKMMDESSDLGESGFCQIYCVTEERENLVAPAKYLAGIGWTGSAWLESSPSKLKSLLRAKAFSLVCEAPAAPVVAKLGLWLIRATDDVAARTPLHDSDNWYRDQIMLSSLEKCVKRALQGPTMAARDFVWKKWHLAPETQIQMEQWFDNQVDVHQIDFPPIVEYVSHELPWWVWSGARLVEQIYR